MTKVNLSNVASLTNESTVITTLANNNVALTAAIENTLSRDGTTPNMMQSDLDMNDNRIINLPDAVSDQEPATFGQLQERIEALDVGGVLTAPYVTLGHNTLLQAERVLSGGANIAITDTGAEGQAVVSINDPELNALALVASAADKVPYFTATGAADVTSFTPYARTLVDDVDAPTARATLGLTLGTQAQAWDTDLDALAGIATNGLLARTGSGTATTRSIVQPAAGITVSNGDGVSANPTFALSNDLGALEALASTGIAARTATDTWAQRTVTGTANEVTLTNGDGVAGNPTVSLPTALTFTGKTVTGGTLAPTTLTINGNTVAATAGTATVTIPNTTDTLVGRATTDTLTGVKTFNNGKLSLAGSTSGSTLLNASATASGTLTLPAATDTLVGKATTDVLTNKTLTAPVISTISNTGTLTLPTSTDTLVGKATTDVFTNKSISGSTNTLSNIALSSHATQAANTIVANATGSAAAPTAVDISTLTTKASPAASDLVMISDQAATGALKKVTVSSLASAGSVSSIAGNTGAFTLSHGLINSTNDIQTDVSLFRGLLSGLKYTTAGASTSFSIGAGACVDSTNTDFMKLTSSITKTTAAWAVGSGNGGLDTGTITLNSWYHIYVIKRPDTGVVDLVYSLNATAPTLPTNYTLYRRIASISNNASNQWTAMSQLGDEFFWPNPLAGIATSTLGTTATLFSLPVPVGIVVQAKMRGFVSTATGTVVVYSPDEGTTTVNSPSGNITGQSGTGAVPAGVFTADIRTNTSQQVKAVASAASTGLFTVVYGWVDRRGKDD
jgi:hypothetical protein